MALTQVDQGLLGTYAQYTGFKNRIINGAMVIDQRNAGASVTPNNSYTLDRWATENSQTSKFTVQQNAGSVTPPVGFKNYLGVTSSSAYSSGASDYFDVCQRIEGYNIADLGWGTANAKTVTLSFWVYSSLTGTFSGALQATGAGRSYPFTYTVSSANTWTQASITIAGDTTGTWNTTNGLGIQVCFDLGSGTSLRGTAGSWSGSWYIGATGAVSLVGTSGATFYITGVQLEKGSTATSFDYRPYGTEEMLCLRYYERMNANGTTSQFALGNNWVSNNVFTHWVYKVRKRATPSFTNSAGTALTQLVNGTAYQSTSISFQDTNLDATCLVLNGTVGITGAQAGFVRFTASNSWVALDSEL